MQNYIQFLLIQISISAFLLFLDLGILDQQVYSIHETVILQYVFQYGFACCFLTNKFNLCTLSRNTTQQNTLWLVKKVNFWVAEVCVISPTQTEAELIKYIPTTYSRNSFTDYSFLIRTWNDKLFYHEHFTFRCDFWARMVSIYQILLSQSRFEQWCKLLLLKAYNNSLYLESW